MPRTVPLYTCENPRSVRPNEEYLLSVKELQPKVLHQAEDFDRNSTVKRTIVVPYSLRDVPPAMLEEAVNYVYSSHGCDHAYDCCGCRVAYTYGFKRTGRGVFTFLVSEGRNY